MVYAAYDAKLSEVKSPTGSMDKVNKSDLKRLKEYFELKLKVEKQVADVVDVVKNGGSKMVLLDVRSRGDYQRGHIRGAISIPSDEIDERYKELPRDSEIVTYCYSQRCHLSTLVALKLVQHGIPAKEMNVGWNEWAKAGHPVHSSESGVEVDCSGQCSV